MKVIFLALAILTGIGTVSAQKTPALFNQDFDPTASQFNALVIQQLKLVRDTVREQQASTDSAAYHRFFFYKGKINGNRVTIEYQLMQLDSNRVKIGQASITGEVKDMIRLYANLYDKRLLKKQPKNGKAYIITDTEWIHLHTDLKENGHPQALLKIQPIIY